MRGGLKVRRGKKAVLFLGLLFALATPLQVTAADVDKDRLPDWWEKRHGFSVDSKNTWGDADGDRLANLKEFRSRTSPRREDHDWDGIDDGDEILDFDSDPRDGDENDNGRPDGNDGYSRKRPAKEDRDDLTEVCRMDDDDSDGDFWDDEDESDRGGDGDIDDDGLVDRLDSDSDNDGYPDGDDAPGVWGIDASPEDLDDGSEDEDLCPSDDEDANDESVLSGFYQEELLLALHDAHAVVQEFRASHPGSFLMTSQLVEAGYEPRERVDLKIDVTMPEGFCLLAQHDHIEGAWRFESVAAEPVQGVCRNTDDAELNPLYEQVTREALIDAGEAMQSYAEENHGAYPPSGAEVQLASHGYEVRYGVSVVIERSGSGSYCLQADHVALVAYWRYESIAPEPAEGQC
jgi:hypothetical protein